MLFIQVSLHRFEVLLYLYLGTLELTASHYSPSREQSVPPTMRGECPDRVYALYRVVQLVQSVYNLYRVCTTCIECVQLVQSVYNSYRACTTRTECVQLVQSVYNLYRVCMYKDIPSVTKAWCHFGKCQFIVAKA